MQKEDFFTGINQVEVKSGNFSTRYPIFFRDVSYTGIFLLTRLSILKDILPSKRMHPFRLTPWHSMFTITATQYTESDVGQYNQLSVGVPFVFDKQTPILTGIFNKIPEVPLIYTLHLAVTTELSLLSGIEIANYPQFLADIVLLKEKNWLKCTVDSEGKNILNLSCRDIPVKPFPRQRVCTVTHKNGRLLRSEFNYSVAMAGISKKQSDVQLDFGDHPTGQKIKELYMGKILQYQYYQSGQAILSSPTESYSLNI